MPSILCGLVSALLINALTGSHLTLGLDEGIYLHGAERVLAGQHLYRNFFALTGPGTFWLFAAWFKLFAPSLVAAHALLSAEIGTIAACAYLVSTRLVNRLAGVTAAILFLALLMPFTHRLYVNHRWDSACSVAIALTLLLLGPERHVLIVAAGFFAGCAAVFTPPTLLVPLTIAVLLGLARGSRRQPLLFTAGAVLPLALTVGVLAMQSSLPPMLQSFAWVSHHYSQANRVPYGFTPPDPNSLEDTVSALHRALVFFRPPFPSWPAPQWESSFTGEHLSGIQSGSCWQEVSL